MDHEIHLMTVAPFIVDTGMVKGSIIRFPGTARSSSLTRVLVRPTKYGELLSLWLRY